MGEEYLPYNQREMEPDLIIKSSLDAGGYTRVKLYKSGTLVIKKGGSMQGEEEAIAEGESYDPSEDMHIEIDAKPALALLNFLLDHRHEIYDLAQGPTAQQQWFAQQFAEWERNRTFPLEYLSHLKQHLFEKHLTLVDDQFDDDAADTRWTRREPQ